MRIQRSALLSITAILIVTLVATTVQRTSIASDKEKPSQAEPGDVVSPSTIDEARGRAKLLHETIHGTLQIMHRDFFDEDNAHAIPSSSLEDVFHELSKSHHVTLRWLNVNTDVVNVDHNPQDDFERRAVDELATGKADFEAVDEGRFRYAGRIRLASQCLKCHVKNRTSTQDRAAGLLISMPIQSVNSAR